jgi:hypothetical protein
MRESWIREFPIHLNRTLIYPFHLLDVQNLYVVIGLLELYIMRAVISAEKY